MSPECTLIKLRFFSLLICSALSKKQSVYMGTTRNVDYFFLACTLNSESYDEFEYSELNQRK